MTTVFSAIRREPIDPSRGAAGCVCTLAADVIYQAATLFEISKAAEPKRIRHGKIDDRHHVVLLISALIGFAAGENLPAKFIGGVARGHVERAANCIAAKVSALRTTQYFEPLHVWQERVGNLCGH